MSAADKDNRVPRWRTVLMIEGFLQEQRIGALGGLELSERAGTSEINAGSNGKRRGGDPVRF